MIALAYLSSVPSVPDNATLSDILDVSRRNNVARGVTGMLCHYDGSYLQFLEGAAGDVQAIFDRIALDPRHRGIRHLYRTEIAARLFPEWSMALAQPELLGPQNSAFCKGLSRLESASDPAHRQLVMPFLDAFRAWAR